jgi:hypothetical protein
MAWRPVVAYGGPIFLRGLIDYFLGRTDRLINLEEREKMAAEDTVPARTTAYHLPLRAIIAINFTPSPRAHLTGPISRVFSPAKWIPGLARVR